MLDVGIILKLCGAGVLCAVMTMLLGKLSVGGTAVRIGGAVLIFGAFAVLLGEALEVMRGLVDISGENEFLGEAFELMMRALGISVLCRLCSGICRDCGEGSIADGIEGAGRVGIFLLTLPLLSDILDFAREVLSIAS